MKEKYELKHEEKDGKRFTLANKMRRDIMIKRRGKGMLYDRLSAMKNRRYCTRGTNRSESFRSKLLNN